MKKFLLFLVIFVSVVSLGLTIYFFAAGNEVISIKSAYIVRDVGETIDTEGLLDIKNPNEKTTLKYSSSNGDVLSFTDGQFVAQAGGDSQIVISTSNSSYARLVIDVRVCDGSKEYPYIIDSAEELSSIGKIEKYTTAMSYELSRDIELAENAEGNWTPFDFSGTLDGKGHKISNVTITEATLAEDTANVGFVATLAEGASISNLVLENISINTETGINFGAVAGANEGQIHNVQANGTIVTDNEGTVYVGGVVGANRIHVDPVVEPELPENPENPEDPEEQQPEQQPEDPEQQPENPEEQPEEQEADEPAEPVVHAAPVIERSGFTGGIKVVDGTNAIVIGGVAGLNNGTISESYYVTGSETATLENYEAAFGGIVGNNVGDITTANIYDSFFYLNAVTENTTVANIGGVTYDNSNSESMLGNQVYGNYYGTSVAELVFNPNQTVTHDTTHINIKYNKLLTAAEFTTRAKFVSYATEGEGAMTRNWNFATVWIMGEKYPVINADSKAGSVYTVVVEDIVPDTNIYTALELYNAIANIGEYASKTFDVRGEDDGTGAYVIDFADVDWKWGDAEHPIPEYMFGIDGADEEGYITTTTGCVIKNLTFANGTIYHNVGLAEKVQSTVIIEKLAFDTVTFEGQDGNYIGVIAGVNMGAHIQDVTIENVTVGFGGFVYGTVAGLNYYNATHAIQNATITNVDAETVRLVYAGGVTGFNYGNIIGDEANYMVVDNVKLCAGVNGGIVGYNGGGAIQYIVANEINFNQVRTEENTVVGGLYSGKKLKDGETVIYNGQIYLGGIAGRNYTGSISYVYAKVTFTAESGDEYRIYAGGITGDNFTYISNAYVYGSTITIGRGFGSYVGGVAGANAGVIASSVVDGAYLNAEIVVNSNAQPLDYEKCSVVGGIVGYDSRLAEGYNYSIVGCASKAKEITGFYAGGIAAIEKGSIITSYCGNSEIKGGDVTITGYMVGGIAAFMNGGKAEDSYVFADIVLSSNAVAYEKVSDAINLVVSSGAGLTVLMMNGAEMKGCYAVVNFSDSGVSFGSMLYVDSRNCTVTGCIYQNAGNHAAEYGKQVSAENMKGVDGFAQFSSGIGSADVSIWDKQANVYPIIDGLEETLPTDEIPFATDAEETEDSVEA